MASIQSLLCVFHSLCLLASLLLFELFKFLNVIIHFGFDYWMVCVLEVLCFRYNLFWKNSVLDILGFGSIVF